MKGIWNGWWDEPEEGKWTSITTSEVLSSQSFTKWYPGEPNGYTKESCGSLNIIGGKGLWVDRPCSNKYCVSCQIPSAPVFVLRGISSIFILVLEQLFKSMLLPPKLS